MPKSKSGVRPATVGSLAELRTLQRLAAERKAAERRPAAAPAAATVSPKDRATRLSPEDVALFRRVVKSVTPHPPANRAILPPQHIATPAQLEQRRRHAAGRPPPILPHVSDRYTAAALQYDDTAFLQAGHPPQIIKDLKKRKWPIQASLDLHGCTVDDARERLDRFVASCREHAIRCVRIVHGKGHGSGNGDSVLKETVRRWLSQLLAVQAYIECEERDGGAGAVLVLLRKPDA